MLPRVQLRAMGSAVMTRPSLRCGLDALPKPVFAKSTSFGELTPDDYAYLSTEDSGLDGRRIGEFAPGHGDSGENHGDTSAELQGDRLR